MYSYVPTMTPYLTGLGFGYSAIGLIGGSYGFSQMLLRLPLGITSDRLGKRKIFIIAGILAGAASSFGMFFARSAPAILGLRLLAGASASAWVAFAVLFSSYFEKEKAASRLSYLLVVNNCGIVLAGLAGSAIADRFGHRYSFLLGGAAGLAAFIFGLFITEKIPERAEPASVKKLLGAVKNKNLLSTSVLAIFAQMIVFATVNTFTPEAAARAGADPMRRGYLSVAATVPAIAASFIGGRIFAKKTRADIRLIIAPGFAAAALGALIIPFAGGMAAIYASSILIGFGCGICMSALLSYCTLTVDEGARSAAMGFFQAVYGLGMFAGPALIGVFVDLAGVSGGFYAVAALALIAGALTFTLLNKFGAAG
jgi:MFS family permease